MAKVGSLIITFGRRCVYCKREVIVPSVLIGRPHGKPIPKNAATRDHDIPKCRIGFFKVETNDVLACHHCNQIKGDMTGPEFMAFRQTKKFAPTYIEFLEKRLAARMEER